MELGMSHAYMAEAPAPCAHIAREGDTRCCDWCGASLLPEPNVITRADP